MAETTAEIREFLEKVHIPCDICSSITCDGFCDQDEKLSDED